MSTTSSDSMAARRRVGYRPDGTPNALELNAVVVTGTAALTSRATVGSAVLDAASSIQSVAEAAKLGELFQYTVSNVTLPRQKSAMLPIITDSIQIERVSIYNASVLRTNPLNGVRLKNTTGKNLLQGPVTVLDKGSYAGDARIDNLPPGQERLLSYGIDLDVLVDNTKNTEVSSLLTAKIDKGVLILDRRVVRSQEYAADNKSATDKMLVVEHPILGGFKLVDTPKPYETTPALYRFKGVAAANKVTTLTIKEEMVQSESVVLLPADISYLLALNEGGELPAAVRNALTRAIELKQSIVDVERQIAERTRSIGEITNEQNRIRENMKTVAQSTQYYDRLLTKLNEQESSIERLQKERAELTTKRDALRQELSDYVSSLSVR